MIYTTNLNESIFSVLVYDNNTPRDVIGLSFGYDALNEHNPDMCVTKKEWAERVQLLLGQYARKYNLNIKELSARPIKYIPEWSVVLEGEY